MHSGCMYTCFNGSYSWSRCRLQITGGDGVWTIVPANCLVQVFRCVKVSFLCVLPPFTCTPPHLLTSNPNQWSPCLILSPVHLWSSLGRYWAPESLRRWMLVHHQFRPDWNISTYFDIQYIILDWFSWEQTFVVPRAESSWCGWSPDISFSPPACWYFGLFWEIYWLVLDEQTMNYFSDICVPLKQ